MKNQQLHDRAVLLRIARNYFDTRNILEVDTPIISTFASIDAHIDLISTKEGRFLHSSPEYAMKRLIANGIGDIFQLSHVFREGEVGKKHNPEFMMAEWYRLNISFQQMIDETLEFIQLFLGDMQKKQRTYRETFIEYAGFDPAESSIDELKKFCTEKNIQTYDGIEKEGLDAFLNLILGDFIEPKLGDSELYVLSHYPASQAALAVKVHSSTYPVAERFEVYYKGVELANGYHELGDSKEQRERFIDANAHRVALGKQPLPIDEHFLKALEKGFPDCCGVAVGFDRLMMLRHQANHIEEVIPFSWNEI